VAIGEIVNTTGYTGPRCDAIDVTAVLNRLRDGGTSVYVIQTMRANPVVFASSLEIVWDIS
jgi:hypothetical protein